MVRENILPCVLPNLRRKVFNTLSAAMKNDLRCGFLIDTFYHVEEVSFHYKLLTKFIMKGCWIISNAFSASIKIIMAILSFINMAQLILTIYNSEFCICQFICNTKIIIWSTFWSKTCTDQWRFWIPWYAYSALRSNNAMPSCVRSPTEMTRG